MYRNVLPDLLDREKLDPEKLDLEKALIAHSRLRRVSVGNRLPPAMNYSDALRNGLRVLVVDSNPDSCELLAILFAEYGIEVITATCAREAIAQIQQAQPDLVISEILLPGEDGYALMRQVKTLETTLQIKIPAIALTVCAGEYERTNALRAGFCRHLLKPLDVDELLETIACLTEQA
jgi:two-component system OmpR family response regulator